MVVMHVLAGDLYSWRVSFWAFGLKRSSKEDVDRSTKYLKTFWWMACTIAPHKRRRSTVTIMFGMSFWMWSEWLNPRCCSEVQLLIKVSNKNWLNILKIEDFSSIKNESLHLNLYNFIFLKNIKHFFVGFSTPYI